MNLIQRIAEANGFETRSYSGSGMYGKSCLAVEVGAYAGEGSVFDLLSKLLEHVIAYAGVASAVSDAEKEALVVAVRGLRTDSMGRGSIAYFPGIAYTRTEGGETGFWKRTRYRGRYKGSAANLLARLRTAGFHVTERRESHGKRVLVIALRPVVGCGIWL